MTIGDSSNESGQGNLGSQGTRPIDEARASEEIERGFRPPEALSESHISDSAEAGVDAAEFEAATGAHYDAKTSQQRTLVSGLHSQLSQKEQDIGAQIEQIKDRKSSSRSHTYSRVKRSKKGRLGFFDYFNLILFMIISGLLVFAGFNAVQAIMANSGDLASVSAEATIGETEFTDEEGDLAGAALTAGTFVLLISLGAYIVKGLAGTIEDVRNQNRFLRWLWITAASITVVSITMFSGMYSGSMGESTDDILGGDLVAEATTSWSDSKALPFFLVTLVVIGEAVAAGAMWIRSETIYNNFYALEEIDTPAQQDMSIELDEKRDHQAHLGVLKIELEAITNAINDGREPYVDSQTKSFKKVVSEIEAERRLRVAKSELENAAAAVRAKEDPGLFKFVRKTGEAS